MCRTGSPLLRKLALGLVVLLTALAIPELALRLAGFRHQSGVQFGYPRPSVFAAFDTDSRLFWKLRSAERPMADDVYLAGNSWGFPGPEIVTPKPAGTYRMLFLGDSCTYQGYPFEAVRMLQSQCESGGLRYEAVVFAVPGYTSHQGRVAAELYGARVEADVVFVYFGWNDHWSAYGSIDAEKLIDVKRSPLESFVAALERELRLVQAALWLSERWRGTARPLDRARVPPDHYQTDLVTIEHIFRAREVPVVLLTAPTSFYRDGVPSYFVEHGFVPDAATAIDRHRRYNQVVREVAARTGATLIDLEANYESAPGSEEFFGEDGVHVTEPGMRWIARAVAAFVIARELQR